MDRKETVKVEAYLRKTFGAAGLSLKPRPNIKDSMEVHIAGEFIGVVTRDDEDGEVSYQFNMAILDIDLED